MDLKRRPPYFLRTPGPIPEYKEWLFWISVLHWGLSMEPTVDTPLTQAETWATDLHVLWLDGERMCFRAGNNWWWVPVVAPCVGAVLGSFIYLLLVEIHHPVEETKNEDVVKEVSTEKWREIPIFTINVDNSLSHRL
ncbi:unnamed protein product [Ranitomeya imitator]|uniref:Uncharacterized protein n=1 Tax=Ranitomeya imitator TaxID=111125 RepID=A0ABN9LI09_9NEOB|nr:unnamed protein product [Ranitomeya imitator]